MVLLLGCAVLVIDVVSTVMRSCDPEGGREAGCGSLLVRISACVARTPPVGALCRCRDLAVEGAITGPFSR